MARDAADRGARRSVRQAPAGHAARPADVEHGAVHGVGVTLPLWAALSNSARELDAEAGGVVALLDRLEQALDRASVAERARPWLDALADR